MSKTDLRFFSHVLIGVGPDSCWLWTGSTASKGYGQFKDGRLWQAHRWSWVFFQGPVPEGLELDHLCRVRNCVNPVHLEPVTHTVNMNRAVKAYCKRGHKRTPDNLCRSGACRQCRDEYKSANREKDAEQQRVRRAKKKADNEVTLVE